MSNGHIS